MIQKITVSGKITHFIRGYPLYGLFFDNCDFEPKTR